MKHDTGDHLLVTGFLLRGELQYILIKSDDRSAQPDPV